MSYSLNWDLDPIYPGGIESPEFAAKLTLLDQQIKQFASDVTAYDRFTDTDFQQARGFGKRRASDSFRFGHGGTFRQRPLLSRLHEPGLPSLPNEGLTLGSCLPSAIGRLCEVVDVI